MALSLLSWLVSLTASTMGSPSPDPFWYASNLHWTYWAGLIMLISTLPMLTGRIRLELLALGLLVGYLYLTPYLLHELPTVFDVYHVIPGVMSIVDSGGVDLGRITFPLSHVFYAFGVMLSGADPLGFSRIVPALIALVVSISIYTGARTLSTGYALLAPVTFLSLNWYMEYHMARQGFGVMLWSIFIMLLVMAVHRRSVLLGILTGLVMLSIIPAHPGMIIFMCFCLVIFTVLILSYVYNKGVWDTLKWFLLLPTAFFGGMLLVYHTMPHIREFVDDLFEHVLSGGDSHLGTGGPTETSQSYRLVNNIRMFMGALQSLIGVVGVIILKNRKAVIWVVLTSFFIGSYFWLGYSALRGGRLIERAFLTAIVPGSLLAVAFVVTRGNGYLDRMVTKGLVVVLALCLILIPIAKNGVDAIETPSIEGYSAGRFAQEHMEGRVVVTDTHMGLFKYLDYERESEVTFRARHQGVPGRDEGGYGYPLPATQGDVARIIFVDYFNNYVEVRYGVEEAVWDIHAYEEYTEGRLHRTYDSGGARVYGS